MNEATFCGSLSPICNRHFKLKIFNGYRNDSLPSFAPNNNIIVKLINPYKSIMAVDRLSLKLLLVHVWLIFHYYDRVVTR